MEVLFHIGGGASMKESATIMEALSKFEWTHAKDRGGAPHMIKGGQIWGAPSL